ncbi:YdcF family protein [Daejeonella sp. JGW-45]|uniref:YdcF family protein n=1 Tax=Daejeonella sp. JGW-45 TaxID=3034148 RepID=UPI0023EB3AF1|nr:YdcF family protein [Daejeonella sp. JGW-45]
MFFILSKVLDFLLSPLVWIMLLFLGSFIIRKSVLKDRLVYSGIALLILFSNPFLAGEAFRAWEGEPQPLKNIGSYDTGIVLTGVAFNRSSAPDRVFFSKGADRVLHAIQLYKIGKITRILITGGSSSLTKKNIPESVRLKEVMLYSGVPDSVIYIESKSRNTRESAAYTKQLVDSIQIASKSLLITSAFHIPRSLGCFRKVGLKVDGYGVDYYTRDRSFNLIPSVNALHLWTVLIHELVGYGTYKAVGYL